MHQSRGVQPKVVALYIGMPSPAGWHPLVAGSWLDDAQHLSTLSSSTPTRRSFRRRRNTAVLMRVTVPDNP
jgi:hypothetical protein